ncbi:hypothetical protein NQ317_003622 [Molorchus minor]|uniref:Uncharacterized protein n=1 Tax=Molorchus minor TaxID=1323400 RepID=A0ABQ9JHI9_9CUCU|nr:hypothetical protein NQ317_003622 [Molorchus minor]
MSKILKNLTPPVVSDTTNENKKTTGKGHHRLTPGLGKRFSHNMDFPTPLIFIALFLLACLSLFLVYKYGIKEKSYEEALAEQRQQTNMLLGTKPKPKEKKTKSLRKKSARRSSHPRSQNTRYQEPKLLDITLYIWGLKTSKEKASTQESQVDESENVENTNIENSNKSHVEFKEDTEEVPNKEVVQIKKDDIYKQEPLKEKIVKGKKQNTEVPPAGKNKRSLKQVVPSNNVVEVAAVPVEKEIEEKVIEPVTVALQTNGIVGNPGKDKKKKKSDYNTRQQLTADRDGLIYSVRKAELSKNEVQLLIDLLLNKQLEAPAVIDDWSEGKSDPVQKLKKQLAEKEKALAEEQQALVGLQQKIRGLEEALQAKLIELQAGNNRVQVNTQKIQQLQTELNAEILKTHKLMEENAALQMQTQQFEVGLTQLQEKDSIIAKMGCDLEELSAQNQQLRLDLQQQLAESDHQEQHYLIQMGNLEKGLKQQIQQLEESHQDLEKKLEIALRQEDNWKIEISNLNTALQQQFEETRRMEHTAEQLKNELAITNNKDVESDKLIAQLRSEQQQLKEEQASQVNGSSQESKEYEIQILNLTNKLSSVSSELSSYKTEVQQMEKKYKAELENSNKKYNKIEYELEEQKVKNNNKSPKSSLSRDYSLRLKSFRLSPPKTGKQSLEDSSKIMWIILNSAVSPHPSTPEKSQDLLKLQAQLQHYKNIIDDTEGMLNKLQLHIESEEINWRNQLAAKEAEIESLNRSFLSPNCVVNASPNSTDVQGVQFAYHCIEKSLPLIINELQTRVQSLETQLSQEISEKQRLLQEVQKLTNCSAPSRMQTDATATIEKLSEEVNRLREQLLLQQSKREELDVCPKAQTTSCNNTSSTNGAALIELKLLFMFYVTARRHWHFGEPFLELQDLEKAPISVLEFIESTRL